MTDWLRDWLRDWWSDWLNIWLPKEPIEWLSVQSVACQLIRLCKAFYLNFLIFSSRFPSVFISILDSFHAQLPFEQLIIISKLFFTNFHFCFCFVYFLFFFCCFSVLLFFLAALHSDLVRVATASWLKTFGHFVCIAGRGREIGEREG